MQASILSGNIPALLGADDPLPYRVIDGEPRSPFLITCDHAGNALPASLGDLGLNATDRMRHIAWDIGAAAMAEVVARELGGFAILQTYSRLVIDCNRPLGVETSIAPLSEATRIPGNESLSASAAESRADAVFRPYHHRIRQELERRLLAEIPTIYVAMHSFTPCYLGTWRPWHAGVLYGRDARFATPVLALLRQEPGIVVGENQPYVVSEQSDYGVNEHAEKRGLLYVEIEVRQDLITDAAGQREWADRLARILRAAAMRLRVGDAGSVPT